MRVTLNQDALETKTSGPLLGFLFEKENRVVQKTEGRGGRVKTSCKKRNRVVKKEAEWGRDLLEVTVLEDRRRLSRERRHIQRDQ